MMAEALKGEAPLKALGRNWTLVLPFPLAKRLKTEHGLDLINDGIAMAQVDKFDLVLEAMLKTNHPEVDLDVAGQILTDVGLKPVMEAMQPALAAFMGVPIEDMKKAGKAR